MPHGFTLRSLFLLLILSSIIVDISADDEVSSSGLFDRLPNVKTTIDNSPEVYIVGGATAKRSRYPYTANIFLREMAFPLFPSCGGTLVAPNLVLTAAHCVSIALPSEVPEGEEPVPLPIDEEELPRENAEPLFETTAFKLDNDFLFADKKRIVMKPNKKKKLVVFESRDGIKYEVITPPYVSIGKFDLANHNEVSETFQVVHVKIHPEYSDLKRVNDIAIIELAGNSAYEPIILADEVYNSNLILKMVNKQDSATVIGWGRVTGHLWPFASPVLMEANLEVVPAAKCAALWIDFAKDKPEILKELVSGLNFDDGNIVCAHGNGERSACAGDSGGPIVIKREMLSTMLGVKPEKIASDLQLGITSYGLPRCDNELVPAVFMNALAARKFIETYYPSEKLLTMAEHIRMPRKATSQVAGKPAASGVSTGQGVAIGGILLFSGMLALGGVPKFSVVSDSDDEFDTEPTTGKAILKNVSRRFNNFSNRMMESYRDFRTKTFDTEDPDTPVQDEVDDNLKAALQNEKAAQMEDDEFNHAAKTTKIRPSAIVKKNI